MKVEEKWGFHYVIFLWDITVLIFYAFLSFFVWTVAWVKILTSENLIKRGYSIVSWCCMCHRSEETVDHLLLHCSVAFWVVEFHFQVVWEFYWRRFLIYYVGDGVGDQISGISFLHVWCGLFGRKEIDILLRMWNACLLNCKHHSLALSMSGLLYWVSHILTLFNSS